MLPTCTLRVPIFNRAAIFFLMRVCFIFLFILMAYACFSSMISLITLYELNILLILSSSVHSNLGQRNMYMSSVHLNGRSLCAVDEFCEISIQLPR